LSFIAFTGFPKKYNFLGTGTVVPCVFVKSLGRPAGFEPAQKDPQSSMLPGYIRAAIINNIKNNMFFKKIYIIILYENPSK
jgi:hypothetical protein